MIKKGGKVRLKAYYKNPKTGIEQQYQAGEDKGLGKYQMFSYGSAIRKKDGSYTFENGVIKVYTTKQLEVDDEILIDEIISVSVYNGKPYVGVTSHTFASTPKVKETKFSPFLI